MSEAKAETEKAEASPSASKLPNFTIGPDGSRVRNLVKPIIGSGGMLDVIKLRKPKYSDIMAFGDPASQLWVPGGIVPHEDMDIIRKYIEALSVDSSDQKIDPALLQQLDYVDVLALKDAALSFFR